MNSIINVNEFFSEHYLADLLPKDVEPLLKAWKAQADEANLGLAKRIHRTPDERLGGLRQAWENAKRAVEDGSDSTWESWYRQLLPVLGYAVSPCDFLVQPRAGEEFPLPVLLAMPATHTRLLIVRLLDTKGEDDPFDAPEKTTGLPWGKVLDALFSMETAPRWVLALCNGGLCLLDSGKWNEKSLLRFDFAQLYFEPDKSIERRVFPALVHADALCPADSSACLLDELESNSHRNAFSVTDELKNALQQCIELLGNEYVYDRRRQKQAVYNCSADELAGECLRYMYRLLFCFYLEARSRDLGFLQVENETYRGGYSLELLRDMEQVPLETEEEQNGFFFSDSLQQLFKLIYEGRKVLATGQGQIGDDFEIPALKSHLFDPESTKHLNYLRVRNVTMQKIIRLMSLGKQGKRSGRISYSRLGLNQLGAVYENLLGYSPFFAREALYEVKPKDEKYDPKLHSFFIKEAQLKDYTKEERAIGEDGQFVRHEPGEFIYRMAGRNRKNSASYYTPESLTQTTVRYALKELLPGMPADDILKLKICEPAVGSAAFLNEAINQLADAYLQRKQQETGVNLAPEDYRRERQRCKMFIADRNVVGVDLNGTAVELAEVSLWLNSIYQGAFVPWFGMQLFHGNSLVGARRHCWPASSLHRSRSGEAPIPYDHQHNRRPATSVYHWLVPDEGMAAAASSKVLADMCPEQVKAMKSWRKDFLRPFTEQEIQTARALSDCADQLWWRVEEELERFDRETTDPLTVWPEPDTKERPATTIAEKDAILDRLLHSPTSPYCRLRLAMDYWCALWFWLPEDAGQLPTLGEFLMEMGAILSSSSDWYSAIRPGELNLPTDDELRIVSHDGLLTDTDVSELEKRIPRLSIVKKLAARHHFFHWELACAKIFRDRGGFDLILGNPPWVRWEFEESDLLSEYEPRIAIRNVPADKVAQERTRLFDKHADLGDVYIEQITSSNATAAFLASHSQYPFLDGQTPNLFKNFITRAWDVAASKHAAGFLHPEGVYDSPKGGVLRAALYPRLRYHFQFQNELKLFGEVHHEKTYSVNVYAKPRHSVCFDSVINLFTPAALDACYLPAVEPHPEGLKNSKGNWSTKGHPERVLTVTENELALFARLYDVEGTRPYEARLPQLHTRNLLHIIQKLADYPQVIASLKDSLFSTDFWNETTSRKDGTIQRKTHFPKAGDDSILSGPHFYVAQPYYKTPRSVCALNSDYDTLSAENLPDNYRARVNYAAACEKSEYLHRSPSLPWDSKRKFIECYKVAFRAMLPQACERTLVAALTCAGTAHVHGVRSLTTANPVDMLAIASMTESLIADFYIKTTGAANLHYKWLTLPLLPRKPLYFSRVLALNCLTLDYAALWKEVWSDELCGQQWYGDDPRLPKDFWRNLAPEWHRNCALRTDFARRWALCELDVMVAREIGLTLDELCEAYRIQFPVLKQNEDGTWYDRNGRIVFTCSAGLKGVGIPRKEFEGIKTDPHARFTKTWMDDTLPCGPVERTIIYEGPFDRRDRETDYATIWAALDEENNLDKK